MYDLCVDLHILQSEGCYDDYDDCKSEERKCKDWYLSNSLTRADMCHSRSKRENESKLKSNHRIYPRNDRLSEIDCRSHIIKFCNDF